MTLLTGKVAIVTGGGGGIGRAISLHLASFGAGIVVADVDLELAKKSVMAVEAQGGRAIAVLADMASEDAIRSMIDQTVVAFGGIDILVNNANETRPEYLRRDIVGLPEIDSDVFDAYMAVGPRGTLFACKHAGPHMVSRGGGAIVNIASVAALKGGVTQVAYAAAKAGMIALTLKVASIYGKQGIRCNAIAPGLIVHERLLEKWPELGNTSPDGVLLNYFGEPQDIANAVGFLATDQSKYITGHTLVVDGGALVGRTIGQAPRENMPA